MIAYYKLFDLMNRKGMKKNELQKVLTSPVQAKLGRNAVVRIDTIDKICKLLDCQPGDIMEYIPDKVE